jgi:hypothetical protein
MINRLTSYFPKRTLGSCEATGSFVVAKDLDVNAAANPAEDLRNVRLLLISLAPRLKSSNYLS